MTKFKTVLKRLLIPLTISLAFFLLSFGSVKDLSYTTDEVSHTARGVMLLRTGDYRINQHHPILFNILHSIPISSDKRFVIEDLDSENWAQAKKDDIAFRLVELNGGRETYSLEFLVNGRFMAATLSAILLFIVYQLLYINFGFKRTVVSTLLLAFSPTLIAHSGLVTTDAPAMFTIFLATLALYHDLRLTQNNSKHIPWLSIILILVALITKYTATLLLPFWLLTYIFVRYKSFGHSIKAVTISTVGIVISILFLLTAAYGFNFATIYEVDYNNPGKIEATMDHLRTIERIVPFIKLEFLESIYKDVELPFPQYFKGFYDNVVKHNFHGHRTYLLGQPSNGGNPLYFPIAFLAKETVPFIIISVFTAMYMGVLAYRNREYIIRKRPALLPLITIPVVLTLLSLSSSINIGIRHLLPVYPFLTLASAFVIVSLYEKFNHPNWYKYIVGILIASHIFLSVAHYPIYIAYFNQVVGQEKYNYLYLQDSNFDWRQENHILEREERELQNTNFIVYPKEMLSTNIKKLEQWQVCLRYKFFANEIEPVQELGHSFFIFEIDNKDRLCDF